MRIIRFIGPDGREHHGQPVDSKKAKLIEGDLFGDFLVTGKESQVEKLLAPVVPPVILCIGLNYRRHAEESVAKVPEFPVRFIKAPGALQNPGDPIILPRTEPLEVDYECELAVVVGKRAKNVSRQEALSYVMGY